MNPYFQGESIAVAQYSQILGPRVIASLHPLNASPYLRPFLTSSHPCVISRRLFFEFFPFLTPHNQKANFLMRVTFRP